MIYAMVVTTLAKAALPLANTTTVFLVMRVIIEFRYKLLSTIKLALANLGLLIRESQCVVKFVEMGRQISMSVMMGMLLTAMGVQVAAK